MRWEDPIKSEKYLIFLTDEPLDSKEFTEFVKDPGAGAVVSFGGCTRDNFDGKGVASLSYEAYTKMALKTLHKIADECAAKYEKQLFRIAVAHRLGSVPVLEESVVIAVSTAHRKEGFEAAAWILERVKERTEVWKKEEYTDGDSEWKENDKTTIPK